MDNDPFLDVLVPPPVALALCVAAGWLANRFWPAPFLPRASPLYAIGFAVAAIGVAIAVTAVVQFRRARTSVRPDRPSSAILSTGPYRYSRNPIYLGMFVVVARSTVVVARGGLSDAKIRRRLSQLCPAGQAVG